MASKKVFKDWVQYQAERNLEGTIIAKAIKDNNEDWLNNWISPNPSPEEIKDIEDRKKLKEKAEADLEIKVNSIFRLKSPVPWSFVDSDQRRNGFVP